MSFWQEHAEREETLAWLRLGEENLRRIEDRHPQDAPSSCATCGHHGTDVLFGVCAGCHSRWYPEGS